MPIKNQVGIAFYTPGTSGAIEIAGGGISYAPASGNLNSNGSSIGLKANGQGFPICQQTGSWPQSGYLPGAPALWLSAGFSAQLNILYFTNEAMPNQ